MAAGVTAGGRAAGVGPRRPAQRVVPRRRSVTDRSVTDRSVADRADRGAVTVEAALALSVLVLVLAGALAAVACLVGHLRCVDAAREAARLAARGDEAGAAAVVTRAAPAGAQLRLDHGDTLVTATVSSRAAGGLLPGITLSATAVAATEPAAADGPP